MSWREPRVKGDRVSPEELRELLPDFALGLLEEGAASEVARYVRESAAARAEARLYIQAAEALTLSAPPGPPLAPDTLIRIRAFVRARDLADAGISGPMTHPGQRSTKRTPSVRGAACSAVERSAHARTMQHRADPRRKAPFRPAADPPARTSRGGGPGACAEARLLPAALRGGGRRRGRTNGRAAASGALTGIPAAPRGAAARCGAGPRGDPGSPGAGRRACHRREGGFCCRLRACRDAGSGRMEQVDVLVERQPAAPEAWQREPKAAEPMPRLRGSSLQTWEMRTPSPSRSLSGGRNRMQRCWQPRRTPRGRPGCNRSPSPGDRCGAAGGGARRG